MKLTFPIVITDESGTSRTEELMILQKSGDTLNDIGLSVSESKQLGSLTIRSAVSLCVTNERIPTSYPVRCVARLGFKKGL